MSVVIVVRNFNHRQKCLLSDTMITQRSVTRVTGIEELPGSHRDHTLSWVRFLVVSLKSSAWVQWQNFQQTTIHSPRISPSELFRLSQPKR